MHGREDRIPDWLDDSSDINPIGTGEWELGSGEIIGEREIGCESESEQSPPVHWLGY